EGRRESSPLVPPSLTLSPPSSLLPLAPRSSSPRPLTQEKVLVRRSREAPAAPRPPASPSSPESPASSAAPAAAATPHHARGTRCPRASASRAPAARRPP